eukprot:2829862-Rhodomonas_salina.2
MKPDQRHARDACRQCACVGEKERARRVRALARCTSCIDAGFSLRSQLSSATTSSSPPPTPHAPCHHMPTLALLLNPPLSTPQDTSGIPCALHERPAHAVRSAVPSCIPAGLRPCVGASSRGESLALLELRAAPAA